MEKKKKKKDIENNIEKINNILYKIIREFKKII